MSRTAYIAILSAMKDALLQAQHEAALLIETAASKDKILSKHGDHWRTLADEQNEIAAFWSGHLERLMATKFIQ